MCASREDLNRKFEKFPSLRDCVPARLVATFEELGPIGARFGDFAQSILTDGQLPATVRELVVLWVAWRTGCAYVWGGHRLIAHDVGLRFPADDEVWDDEEALALSVANQLIDGTLDPRTRRRAVRRWGRPGLVELAAIVGQYELISMVVAAAALEPEPGTLALPAAWPGPVGPGCVR